MAPHPRPRVAAAGVDRGRVLAAQKRDAAARCAHGGGRAARAQRRGARAAPAVPADLCARPGRARIRARVHGDLRSLVLNTCQALLRQSHSPTARIGCYHVLPASACGVLRRCWRSCASTCRPPTRSTGAPAPPAHTWAASRPCARPSQQKKKTRAASSDSRAIGTGDDSGVPACGATPCGSCAAAATEPFSGECNSLCSPEAAHEVPPEHGFLR